MSKTFKFFEYAITNRVDFGYVNPISQDNYKRPGIWRLQYTQ